jgi:PRC-barrel domain protein
MDHPKPWLRYVEADELESPSVNFADVKAESSSGEQLGEIDGFVVDARSGRPYYAAIDAGGWFKSKLFLLPIGHTTFDRTRKRLVADVTRERVNNFPGFDRREFETLSDEQLQRIDEQIVAACCPTEKIDRATIGSRFDRWSHYKSPDWWSADFYRPDRVDKTAQSLAGAGSTPPAPGTKPRASQREAIVAQSDDVSPHAGGRAQPGDVLGVETGGERTYVGDTSENENKRRRDAERSARRK